MIKEFRSVSDVGAECVILDSVHYGFLTEFIDQIGLRKYIIDGDITVFVNLIEQEIEEKLKILSLCPHLAPGSLTPKRLVLMLLYYLDKDFDKLDVPIPHNFQYYDEYRKDLLQSYYVLRHYISIDKFYPWVRDIFRSIFIIPRSYQYSYRDVTTVEWIKDRDILLSELIYPVYPLDTSLLKVIAKLESKYQSNMKSLVVKMRLKYIDSFNNNLLYYQL